MQAFQRVEGYDVVPSGDPTLKALKDVSSRALIVMKTHHLAENSYGRAVHRLMLLSCGLPASGPLAAANVHKWQIVQQSHIFSWLRSLICLKTKLLHKGNSLPMKSLLLAIALEDEDVAFSASRRGWLVLMPPLIAVVQPHG